MRLPSYQAISPDETSPLNTQQVVEQGTFSPVGSNDSTPATPSSSLTPIMTKKASGVIVFLGAAWCGMLLYLGISPLSMDALKPWNYRSLAGEANTIKMCVKEMVLTTKQNSVGALVECWDKDVNEDDRMCEGTTGQNGCVVMNYKEQAWDGAGGRSPDIYCSVNKQGFVQSTPPDKDHHDQSKQAAFQTTLYRDRSFDYGKTNGCGPEMLEGPINDITTFILQFGDQCFQHDRCYWDCQILNALGGDTAKAQEFCDSEMYEGMKSTCYFRHGDLPENEDGENGENTCLDVARGIYHIGLQVGATAFGAYTLTPSTCKNHESLSNNYDETNCSPNGHKCGYDGTTSDDTAGCRHCCNSGIAKDEGDVWDDWYCVCLPRETFCASTLAGRTFNYCDRCCSRSPPRIDDGWVYDNSYCS
jgi:hypothetical protein